MPRLKVTPGDGIALLLDGLEEARRSLQRTIERPRPEEIEKAVETVYGQIEREGQVMGSAAIVLRRDASLDECMAELLVDHDVLRFLTTRTLDAEPGSLLLAARLQLLLETWEAHATRVRSMIDPSR